MYVYYVLRSGVYDQGIYGIFSSRTRAKLALLDAKDKEKDNYHDFTIYKRNIDEKGYDEIIAPEILGDYDI